MDPSSVFDFALSTRVVYGPGSIARLGELARGLGARRVWFVTDPGLIPLGHVERAAQSLRAAGCETALYAEVESDPDASGVERCARAARDFGPEVLVALGGGSAIDVAKGAAMLLANGGRMQDYWGYGKTHAPLLPQIAVPTTAGTGSEVQSYALIADEVTRQKMACGAADAAPRVALLDPELTWTLPPFVTACTGLDALGHALETAVTRKRSALSALFSREAFALLARNFARVLRRHDDHPARAGMLLGATWAGLAIEHSMLGAAHSLANPLSVHCGLAHGLAVGLALPAVVRFNAEDLGARATYADLARLGGLATAEQGEEDSVEALLAFLGQALAHAGVSPGLSAHGVTPELLPTLAAEASRQWTAQFNPRDVGEAELAGLLAGALRGV